MATVKGTPWCIGSGAAAATNATTTITPAFPTGLLADDILITICETANQSIGVPAGWNHVTGSPVVQGTDTTLSVIWRRYVVGDVAQAITVTSGDHIAARTIGVRGCPAAGNPWDVIGTGTEATVDTSASFPGVTTTVPRCLILELIAASADVASTAQVGAMTNANYSTPHGLTERADNFVSTGNGGGIGAVSALKITAGATGNSTLTLATAAAKAMMTLALKGADITLSDYQDYVINTLSTNLSSFWHHSERHGNSLADIVGTRYLEVFGSASRQTFSMIRSAYAQNEQSKRNDGQQGLGCTVAPGTTGTFAWFGDAWFPDGDSWIASLNGHNTAPGTLGVLLNADKTITMGGVTSTDVLTDGPHLFVWTWTSGDTKLYVDNVLWITSSTSHTPVGVCFSLHSAFAANYSGLWDDSALWDRVLSADERAGLMEKSGYAPAQNRYSATVKEDSPSIYLRLGDASGATATDDMGALNGTYVNAGSYAAANPMVAGNDVSLLGHDFNGSSTHITLADNAATDLGDTFSIEFWFKRDATGSVTIFDQTSGPTARISGSTGIELYVGGTKLCHTLSSQLYSDLNWHHCVLVKDPLMHAIYVDAAQQGYTSTAGLTGANGTTARIGSTMAGAEFFNGILSEFALYKSALSYHRIKAHYEAGMTERKRRHLSV